ncbi:MAG: HPr family phosphocarrier protein [Kiritimatiellia bacterium]|nr:HPr family phosphocarrier protein [Kiritimatiellia bacterium]
MIKMTANINNHAGIHCRPSAVIVKAMLEYEGLITVSNELGEANLKSVMGLMTLALRQGNNISISVDGPNEKEICEKLVELFETHFDFPPRENGTLSNVQRPTPNIQVEKWPTPHLDVECWTLDVGS